MEKTYNITKQRPQVALIGNGPFYGRTTPWPELIHDLSETDISDFCTDATLPIEKRKYEIPYSLLASIGTSSDDGIMHKKYFDKLNHTSGIDKSDPNLFTEKLLQLNLDAIITTNYTYEIENAINNQFGDLKDKSKYYQSAANEVDKKYLLHTYNKISENTPSIWHMHGEARNKSSVVLTHDEYARLISKIVEYISERGNFYSKYKNDFRVKSWVDYFIVADMYIIGQGFDYSEFDLWWLLSRRKREKDKSVLGNVIYFEAEPAEKSANFYKQKALKRLGVNVENLGFTQIELDNNKAKYPDFYLEAIKCIENN